MKGSPVGLPIVCAKARGGGYVPSKAVQQKLLDIDWTTERALHQAIPPSYYDHLGRQLLTHLETQ